MILLVLLFLKIFSVSSITYGVIRSALFSDYHLTSKDGKFYFQKFDTKEPFHTSDQIAVFKEHLNGLQIMYQKKSLHVTPKEEKITAGKYKPNDIGFLWVIDSVLDGLSIKNEHGCLEMGDIVGPLEGLKAVNKPCNHTMMQLFEIVPIKEKYFDPANSNSNSSEELEHLGLKRE